MKVSEKAKTLVGKITNLSNNALISVPLDALSAVFPRKQKNEDAKRAADRAKARSGDLGAATEKEPALVNGHLNRDKILVGTTAFYADEHFTEADVKRIADGGFDFVVSVADGEFRDRLLEGCEKHGVGVIARSDCLPTGEAIRDLQDDAQSVFDAYRKHPAQVGDSGWDEPNARDFDCIGRFGRLYKKALPEQLLFNNLFPAGATKEQTGADSFREYVELYSKKVDTDYISTDIYPFHPLAVMNKFSMAMCLHTYHCLGDVCRRDGKDFWLYIQTQGNWFSHIYALPTPELIGWQCRAALAYGARSLIHVSYTPVWDKDAYAMLDKDGSLTEQYIYAKRINAEIQRLSGVLKSYRSLGVVPAEAKKENPHFALAVARQKKNNREQGFDGIPPITSVTSESTALTGYFENPDTGANALMLVNCKNLYDVSAKQKIRVKFASPVNIKVYAHGKLKMSRRVERGLEFAVGSCDGVFIEFEEI